MLPNERSGLPKVFDCCLKQPAIIKILAHRCRELIKKFIESAKIISEIDLNW